MNAAPHDDPERNALERVASRARQVAGLVAGLMFAAVFLIFNYKIVTRYLGHDEAVWADEVSVILFVWIIFWANAFLVRDKEQITFDLVYRPMPGRIKRVMALARSVLIGGLFLWRCPDRSATSFSSGVSGRPSSICGSTSSIPASACSSWP